MPTYEKLQEICLKLITTPIQYNTNDDCVHLFDAELIQNDAVQKLITNICLVATAQPNSISELVKCFDFIIDQPPESSLKLTRNLHPEHQSDLKIIHESLRSGEGIRLRELNSLEINLCALLNCIVRKNINLFPEATIQCLQKGLLGDEDEQLQILSQCNEFFSKQEDPEIANFINQLKTTVKQYNSVYQQLINNLAKITREKGNRDLDHMQQLFDTAYYYAIEAHNMGCPKASLVITTLRELHYEFVLDRDGQLRQAIRDDVEEDVQLRIKEAKSWAKQSEQFEHPNAQKFLQDIDDFENAYQREQANKKFAVAENRFGLIRKSSKYGGFTFKNAADLASRAKEQGSKEAAQLLNTMHNSKLEKETREISISIKEWLKNYTQDIPEDILNTLNFLKKEIENLSKDTLIDQIYIDSIDTSFKIIQARNLLVKDKNLDDAKLLIDEIKNLPHIAIPSINEIFIDISNSVEQQKSNRIKPSQARQDSQEAGRKTRAKNAPSKKTTTPQEKTITQQKVTPRLQETVPTSQEKTTPTTQANLVTPATSTVPSQSNPSGTGDASTKEQIASSSENKPPTRSPKPNNSDQLRNNAVSYSTRISQEINLRTVISPIKPTVTEVINKPNFTPTQIQPHKSPELPQKNSRNIFRNIGIALLLIGLILITTGIVLLTTVATGGLNIAVSGMVGLGAVMACAGVCSLLTYHQRRNLIPKNHPQDKLQPDVPSQKETDTEKNDQTYHPHPTNLYARKSIVKNSPPSATNSPVITVEPRSFTAR